MSYAEVLAKQPDQQDILWDGTFAINPNRITKIGTYEGTDATKRHSVEHFKLQHERVQAGTAIINEVFRGLPLSLGYQVSTLYSYNFKILKEAREFESKLLADITPNVLISSQWSGFTECRYFTNKQILECVKFLYSIYPPYNKNEDYRYKVYFQVLDKLPQMKEIPQFIIEGGRFNPDKLNVMVGKSYLLEYWNKKKATLV